jgi:hypothetical protein
MFEHEMITHKSQIDRAGILVKKKRIPLNSSKARGQSEWFIYSKVS